MKRTVYGILCLFFLFSCSNSSRDIAESDNLLQPIEDEYFVDQAEAEEIAKAFFGGEQPVLLGTDATNQLKSNVQSVNTPSYYIFSGQSKGYVIVSASEVAYPILGYSRDGNLDMDDLPCCLEMLLGVYSGNINRARELYLEPSDEIRAIRANTLRSTDPVGQVVVQPLMADIHWDQMPHYNALCPSPASVPVGCVATATSQILRFWEYPERAKGYHSYNSANFGIQSHDFNYDIDWSAMPKGKLEESNFEVARLCYGVAVSVNMNFDYAYNGGSGAMQTTVPDALIRFYGYPKTVTNALRYQYTNADWINLMKDELDNGRPIQYGGSGTGGGHSFILDGYDDQNYFHVNWGWGGDSDGWFLLDALNPSSLGTGGGSGGFNQGQHAVIHFAPPQVVKGDNDEPIIEDGATEEPVINTVTYKEVWVLNPSEIFIRYTQFNGVETSSSARGYEAFLKKKIVATIGGTVSYVIEPEVAVEGMIPAYVIAVDFNNDGVFDIGEGTNELVVLKKPGNADTLKGSFNIPATVGKGTYRMRVNIDNNALRDPNGGHMTGEFEDYQLTIN